MPFANITKSEGESIQNYLIHLKSTAKDCEYTCPNCNSNLQHLHIKDQFIRGLYSPYTSKGQISANLTDIIKHAEAFETALHDQLYLQKPCDHAARVSDYKKSKRAQNHHVQGVTQQHTVHLNDPQIAQHEEDNVSIATNSIILPKYVGNYKKTQQVHLLPT